MTIHTTTLNEKTLTQLATVLEDIDRLSQSVAALEGTGAAMGDNKAEPLSAVAEFYFKVVAVHEVADKVVKRAYHLKERYNKGVIPQRMTDDNVDGLRVPSIARSFSVVKKTSASFIDKEKGLQWLRETGQGDMIQETVNAGTLSTFCRNMLLEEGIEPPADLVKMNTYDTTSMVKYTPK